MKYLITAIAALVVMGCGPSITIHKAAFEGKISAVEQHLAAGTDVNAKNDFESTPLIVAASEGHKEVAELLIAKGADVDAMNEAEVTSLHYAALRGHMEIIKLLLAKVADVNAKARDGNTPLDYANWTPKYDSSEVEVTIIEIATIIEIDDLIRKHGGKRGEELKATGN